MPKSKPKRKPQMASPPPRWIWIVRLALAMGAPILFLLALEGVLRLNEFGYSTHFFLPVQTSEILEENPKFGWRFFPRQAARVPDPVRLTQQKQPQTYRIFVFGESAALGDPASAYGLSRFLSVLLTDRFPGRNFEVINTAMTAINSNVILPIANDCAPLGGDCWVFYMGNNEVVGPFGAGAVFGPPAPPLPIIRANLAFRSLRTGQWFESMIGKLGKGKPTEWGGMEMMLKAEVPAADPRLQRMYGNFSRNLDDCIARGVRSGAKVVVSSMAVSLRECPPFASLHRAALSASDLEKFNEPYSRARAAIEARRFADAIEPLRAAEKIDGDFAELQYCLGLAESALGHESVAVAVFEKARDLDALRFRCDSELNRRIASVKDALFVDTATRLKSETNLFLDHVHFTFHGNYLLARGIADEVARALALKPDKAPLAETECAARLAYTDWDNALIRAEMLERYRRPPFTNQLNAAVRLRRMEDEVALLRREAKAHLPDAIDTYRKAIAQRDNDYILRHRFGAVLEAAGNDAEAGAQWKRAVELMPQSVDATFKVGTTEARLDHDEEAEKWFRKTIALRPTSVEAHNELALILATQGKTNEAVVEFKEALRIKPSSSEAHVNWGLMLENLGAIAEAEEHYRTALSLNPQSLPARLNLAKLLLSKKQTDAALAEYREAVKLHPGDATAHFNFGGALQDIDKLKEAQAEYELAVRYEPTLALAHLNLGVLLANSNSRTEARSHFEAAVAADPKLAEAEFYLGMTYLQDNRLPEGAAHLEKALAINPQHTQARAYLDQLHTRQKGQ